MNAWFTPTKDFVALVAKAHEEFQEEFDPSTSVEDLWESFLFPMFLGPMVRGAQAKFAQDRLREHLTLARARTASEDGDWTSKFLAVLDKEIGRWEGRPHSGLKIAVLKTIRTKVDNRSFVETVHEVSQFLDKVDITLLKKNEGDLNKESTFAVRSVSEYGLHGIGFTGFAIWMHDAGFGSYLTPPCRAVSSVLRSDDIKYSGSVAPPSFQDEGSDEFGTASEIQFVELCTLYTRLTEHLRRDVAASLIPRETQHAAWAIGTSRGLFGRDWRVTKKVTAAALVHYMADRSLTLEKYIDRIMDIDRWEDLRDDLKMYLGG